MNDLQTLRAALTPDEPDQDVVDRSRHQLQNRIHGGRPGRKRVGWLSVGVGLTAAAAAAAVAISVVPADGPATPTDNASTVKTVTGKDVLLAAATAAEGAPEGAGTYWHVTVTVTRADGPADVWEYWTKQDGQEWFAGAKTDGKPLSMDSPRAKPFSLVGVDVTLGELRALPTEPAALKSWITEAIRNGDGRTSAGPFRDQPEMLEQATFDSLISLVSTLPAPPEVRATAFRALAAYPGVESLGDVPGGKGLLLPGDVRLVVDPATGLVNGTSFFVIGGALYTVDEHDSAKITGEWTDTLPQ
jgi:hypothetical protein